MIWQVWADIATGGLIPVGAFILYRTGIIPRRHLWLMAWGFAVGATWEFSFYFLGESVHAMKTPWPLPIITLHLCHTIWDAGLFIVGFWLCLLILRTPDCCTRFRWPELAIMWVWGGTQEFVVELLGNGVLWEYQVHSWNPVWITINGQGYTALPQLIWAVAPILYYLGVICINRIGADPTRKDIVAFSGEI